MYIPAEERRGRRADAWRPIVAAAAAQGRRHSWLAEQVGVSQRVFWRYVHGYDRIPQPIVDTLCNLLGVPKENLHTDPPELFYRVKQRPGRRYRRLSAPVDPTNATTTTMNAGSERSETHGEHTHGDPDLPTEHGRPTRANADDHVQSRSPRVAASGGGDRREHRRHDGDAESHGGAVWVG